MTYLASLGKAQTAAVKRDAEIGVAQVLFFPLLSGIQRMVHILKLAKMIRI